MASPLKDLLSSVLLIALGVAVHVKAREIVPRFRTGVDSGFFPEIVSATLIVVGGIIAFTALRTMKRARPDGIRGSQTPARPPVNWFRVWGAAGVTLLYIAALPRAGFLIATFVFLVAQFCLLAPKAAQRPLVFTLIAMVATFAIHLIFVRGFGLPLPRGPF